MILWFENHLGIKRQIYDCETWEDVCRAINKFIEQKNEGKPEDKKFKSYYMRTWEEDGMTKIDVGSWNEFSYWEGKYHSNK